MLGSVLPQQLCLLCDLVHAGQPCRMVRTQVSPCPVPQSRSSTPVSNRMQHTINAIHTLVPGVVPFLQYGANLHACGLLMPPLVQAPRPTSMDEVCPAAYLCCLPICDFVSYQLSSHQYRTLGFVQAVLSNVVTARTCYEQSTGAALYTHCDHPRAAVPP